MTEGHRHRHVRLPLPLVRLLVRPLASTDDPARAYRSRWVWAVLPGDHTDNRYVLTPLSVLHTLTGLTLKTPEK